MAVVTITHPDEAKFVPLVMAIADAAETMDEEEGTGWMGENAQQWGEAVARIAYAVAFEGVTDLDSYAAWLEP